MVTGCQPPDIVDPDVYRRLVTDLRANNKLVIADLTGAPLRAALEGGVGLLRLSEEELVSEGYAASDEPAEIVAGALRLNAAGARTGADLPGLVARGADRRCHRVRRRSNWSLRCSRPLTTAAPATPCLPRPASDWRGE